MKHHSLYASILFLGLALANPLVSQAPSYTPFGTGCPGSLGVPALDRWGSDLPRYGTTFTAQIHNVPNSAFAIGILGLSNTSFGAAPLPFDLGIIGMPGCTLYTDSRRQSVLPVSGERALWDLVVPADPDLLGQVFYQQVLVLENILGGPGSSTMSNAAEGVVGDLPDLIIDSTAPSVNPLTVLPGGTVTVSSWAVRNIGAVPAGGSANGWYLQEGQLPRVTDVLLAQRPAGSFAAGERTIVSSRSMVIPGDTPPGDYWLGVRADHTKTVAEWKEWNNSISTRVTVLQPLPDLVISSGSPAVTPNPVVSGATMTVPEFDILNQGFFPATRFDTGIYLSTNPIISAFDTLLDTFWIPGLIQGSPRTIGSRTVTIPVGLTPGDYWIGILADRNRAITEMDETNNYVATRITVRGPLPDLYFDGAVHLLNPIVRPFPGFPIPVICELFRGTNLGGTPSGPFRIGLYFSWDDDITTKDELIHTIDVPGLAPGEFQSWYPIYTTIPFWVPPGRWFVGAIIDDTNVVMESNEGNNTRKEGFVLVN